jgi:hypothetical protein
MEKSISILAICVLLIAAIVINTSTPVKTKHTTNQFLKA